MNTRRRNRKRTIALALLGSVFAGCADNSPAIRDTGEEQRSLQCAADETLSCVEKLGKTQRCVCSSRDDLRRILEPDKR